MAALRNDVLIYASTGKLAPVVIPTISSLARIPVGLNVEIGVPAGIFGVEVKRVIVDGTSVDDLGQRWYTGTINNVSFEFRAERLEKFLGMQTATPVCTSIAAH